MEVLASYLLPSDDYEYLPLAILLLASWVKLAILLLASG